MFDFKGFVNLFYFRFKPIYCLNTWYVLSKTGQSIVLVGFASTCTYLPAMPWQSAKLNEQAGAA